MPRNIFFFSMQQKMQNEEFFITYPTWKKYIVMSKAIDSLRVKDKRHIFQVMRKTECLSHDTFFPRYGFTAGDFSIWQILCDGNNKKKSL